MNEIMTTHEMSTLKKVWFFLVEGTSIGFRFVSPEFSMNCSQFASESLESTLKGFLRSFSMKGSHLLKRTLLEGATESRGPVVFYPVHWLILATADENTEVRAGYTHGK